MFNFWIIYYFQNFDKIIFSNLMSSNFVPEPMSLLNFVLRPKMLSNSEAVQLRSLQKLIPSPKLHQLPFVTFSKCCQAFRFAFRSIIPWCKRGCSLSPSAFWKFLQEMLSIRLIGRSLICRRTWTSFFFFKFEIFCNWCFSLFTQLICYDLVPGFIYFFE